ncbi:MAG: tetratricopeptide repeat protein [Cystobacter sp.]
MKVSCPSCQTNYNIDDKRIPPGGAKLKCARCQNTFPIKAEESPAPAAPPQPEPSAPRVSAPSDFSRQDFTETTRVMSMPLPSAAYRDNQPPAAIPLPGPEPTPSPFDAEPAYASQSYASDPGAIPLPGNDVYGGQAQADAVPLPGASDFGYARDPYAQDPHAAQSDAVALPPPVDSGEPYAYAQDSYAQDAVALPPPVDAYAADDGFGAASSGADDFALPPPPAADPFASAQADDAFATGADAFALPPPAEEAYAAAEVVEDDPFALPPVAGGEEPYAAAEVVEDDPFALPPVAGGAAYASPMMSGPASMDVGLDFSEPPPMGASIPDALEFDPTAPVAQGGDDLEADLSAPLPPPPTTGSADGLEMLSFIDDAAKDGGNKARAQVRRFQVRRRSGKVFGPFEEGVVVKMLEDGQLLGNEEVSPDGEAWAPIGTVPLFATAIAKLMEGPGTPASAAVVPAAAVESTAKSVPAANAATAANMERINQLYGGRMAQVSVVDTTSRMEVILGKVKKRLPLVISLAAGAVVVITGLSFGATRYGVFGVKKFFPAQVKPGDASYADVETARKALLKDSLQGYKEALQTSARVLEGKESPDVRALWCQSVFYLQRRYSAASNTDLVRCRSEEERGDLELLGEHHPEFLKYQAGAALQQRQWDEALTALADANKGDVEVALLVAEAQTGKKRNADAIATLQQVVEKQPELARAQHALGNLYQAEGKADEAVRAYEAALKADATHIISSVELAAVELLLRQQAPQKGLEAAERALDEKLGADLGASELSRARTLKGIALLQLDKLPEAEQELRIAVEKDPDSRLGKRYLASTLQAQRKYEEALPLLEAVAKAEAESLETTESYVSLLVTLDKREDAKARLEEAMKRFPKATRFEYLYGRVQESLGSNSAAEEHYTRALKAEPGLIEAQVALGRLHLRLRHNDQAREMLTEAASKAPESALPHVGLGELALAEEDIARAQEEFQRAVGFDAHSADAHLGLSRLALLAGDVDKAGQEIDKALEQEPYALPGGRLQRGLVRWRQGKLEEALADLELAKKQDARSVGTAVALGALYLEKGSAARGEQNESGATADFKKAEGELMQALKLEPSNAEANYHLAQVKAQRGEFTQAIESMKTAVERAAKRPDYHFALGQLYRDAKQPADAITAWKKTVELDPKRIDAYEALGQAHLERSEVDDAISSFQAALKVDPKRGSSYASVGDAHFTAMHWRDAVRSYEQALKTDPALTGVYYKLGRAWSEQNQYGKAIDWYKKAIAVAPDNADGWYHLGYAYKEKGKKKDAVTSFREYLTRKPDAQDRKEIEDEITFLQ